MEHQPDETPFRSQERTADTQANHVVAVRSFYAYEWAGKAAPGNHLLEVGAGIAKGAAYLAGHAQDVVALDYDERVIAYNRKRFAEHTNLSFVVHRVPPLPFEANTFDQVVTFQFIEHLRERQKLIEEIHRVLKPGGQLFLTTPNRAMTLAPNPYHVHEYSFAEMRKAMDAVFPQVELIGLFGNDRVMAYHHENTKWVRRFLRFDVLNLHKHLPPSVLTKPYDLVAGMMRRQLADKQQDALHVTTDDFLLKADGLENAFDIYVRATKAA